MPMVRGIRGVCVGVAQHMLPGDVRDLDQALATYLINIGAVEPVAEPAPVVKQPEPVPVKSGPKEKQP